MSTPPNSPFSVSKLRYPLPAWRYWVLFQSGAQLCSFVLIVLACALIIHGLALASGARVMPPAYLTALLALGGLVSVIMVLPAQFTMAPAGEAAVRRLVTEIEVARHVEDGVVDNAVRHRQNLPRLLRWSEGTISVARADDTLVVTGPVLKLRNIRKQLLTRR